MRETEAAAETRSGAWRGRDRGAEGWSSGTDVGEEGPSGGTGMQG